MTGAIACAHLDTIRDVEPSAQGCQECLKLHEKKHWKALLMCEHCGHVGCDEASLHQHASKHFHSTRHPIVRSFEPGEHWKYCYIDELKWE